MDRAAQSTGCAQQLRLKITGGYDQFAGHEAWQMDMVEADAPDEATRWRVLTEVAASWDELQSPKFISRSPKIAAPSAASNAAAAKPDGAPVAANRGARRAASRNPPAAAAVEGGSTGAVATAAAAAVSSVPVAAAAAAGQDAPVVQSYGIGLPPRPKRNASK